MNSLPFTFSLKTGSDLLLALQERKRQPVLVTRVTELDQMQGGGLRRGSFVAVHGDRSSGRFAIALAALAAATQAGEAAALVDAGDHLDPQEAEARGIDVRRLLWLRPPSPKLALLSAEMVLTTGFTLVVLDLGETRCSARDFPEAAWLRLARAASEQKSILLVISLTPLESVVPEVVVQTHGHEVYWSAAKADSSSVGRMLKGLSVQVTVRQRKGERDERVGNLTFLTRESAGQ